MATNVTIEQAQKLLEEAKQATLEAEREERRRAEVEAQRAHDRAHVSVVDGIVRSAERAIAEAAKAAKVKSPVSRAAMLDARRFLYGSDHDLTAASAHDPVAGLLAAAVLELGRQFERLAGFNDPRYRPGERRIGAELAQRITDVERKVWGALVKRLRYVAGDE
jgi:hypothetical protein